MKLGPRRRVGAALAAAGALAVAAASFLPWARSGRAPRTSYGIVRAAERLDVVDGAAATAARAWYLVPLAAVVTWLAASLGRPRLAAAFATVVALAAVALAWAVKASPLRADVGGALACGSAGVALVGAAMTVGRTGGRR